MGGVKIIMFWWLYIDIRFAFLLQSYFGSFSWYEYVYGYSDSFQVKGGVLL